MLGTNVKARTILKDIICDFDFSRYPTTCTVLITTASNIYLCLRVNYNGAFLLESDNFNAGAFQRRITELLDLVEGDSDDLLLINRTEFIPDDDLTFGVDEVAQHLVLYDWVDVRFVTFFT